MIRQFTFCRDLAIIAVSLSLSERARDQGRGQSIVTSMNIPDLVFLTGPFGGLVLALLSVTAIAVVKRPRWVFILGAALTAVFALSFIAYWFLWVQAFDYADLNKPVPAVLDIASNVAMTMCSIASLALVVLAVAAVVAARLPGGRMKPTTTLDAHL